MVSSLPSVSLLQSDDGSWLAMHEPSGRGTQGESPEDAESAMRILLGLDEHGVFVEPSTADRFEGVAHDIAEYLEGKVSNMLALHSGFARLEGYQNSIATIRLGGGCQGCPSSRLTLMNGVKRELQDTFGEELVMDVYPILD